MPKKVNMAKKEAKQIEPKSEPKTEIPTNPTMDFEKMIADALAKQEQRLKLEFEAKLQETKKEHSIQLSEVTETIEPIKENKTQASILQRQVDSNLNNMRRRRFIPDDARIRIELNIDGKFIIADTRGNNYFVELNGYKDTTTISFKDLKNFHGKNHSFLNKGKIIVTDVISDSEVDIQDAIEDLNLQRLYNNEEIIRPFEIEDYLSSDISIEEFSTKAEKSREYLETIIEVAVILFKRGQFTDNSKMNKLREITRMPELFTK